MDNWVRVGVIAAVMQTILAAAVFWGLQPPGMEDVVPWQVLLAVITLFTWWALYRTLREVKRAKVVTTPSPIPTRLRLQFGSVGTVPTEIDQENVWQWCALAAVMHGLEAESRKIIEVGRMWNVFLIFDKPTTFRQIRVDGNGVSLPQCEVKSSSVRGAVIAFSGSLEGVIVDIRLLF